MYSINIPFKDYFGHEHEKEFTFNLSSAEVLELEANTNGGLRNAIDDLSSGRDPKDLTKFFSMLIRASYGVISSDGMYFDKSDDAWNKFRHSPAYNEFFMRVMTNDSTAINFINGILPGPTE